MTGPASVSALIRSSALPASEATALLACASGLSREQLITRDAPFDEALVVRFQSLCARRSEGEPIAYLTGEREFYGRRFRVTPDVLIPRPETELLVDWALERSRANACVLDLGTGSGAIAVSIACERLDLRVTASDVSPRALDVARENARRLGAQVDFVESDWLRAFAIVETAADNATADSGFDIIVSNPPYVRAGDAHLEQGDLRFEPRAALAAGFDGLSALRRIIRDAPAYLVRGGWLMLEHGFDQAGQVRAELASASFADVCSLRDLAGIERVTMGRR